MSKKLFFGLAALLLAVLACSPTNISFSPNTVTGSGNVVSETRNVSGFDAVDLQGSGNVTVSLGSTESVVVKADDNIVPVIETTVQNGKLIISTKDNTNITTSHEVQVTVVMKSLQGLTLSGSGNIDVSGVAGGDISIHLPGSGTVKVNGTSDNVDVSLNGSGNILADHLQAKSATVSLNGSGTITVFASEKLDASIHGSGTIHYSGNPSQVSKNVSGSGTITP